MNLLSKIEEIIMFEIPHASFSPDRVTDAARQIKEMILNEVINTCDDIGEECLDDGESRGAWACSAKFEEWI